MAHDEITPIVLGRIAGVFGVKGWLKVFSYTEPREAILEYENWWLLRGDSWQAVAVEEGKPHGKTVIAKLAGVGDRDTAAALIDLDIVVPRDELPETQAGEYYWADLEGLRVVHRGGRSLGKVAYLMATGAHDVLVVQGDRETLIPFVMEEVILDVDLDQGVISVDWEWD
ncbi:MAG: ribosome maturation factor RimM [Woeseiaceae bacterium]